MPKVASTPISSLTFASVQQVSFSFFLSRFLYANRSNVGSHSKRGHTSTLMMITLGSEPDKISLINVTLSASRSCMEARVAPFRVYYYTRERTLYLSFPFYCFHSLARAQNAYACLDQDESAQKWSFICNFPHALPSSSNDNQIKSLLLGPTAKKFNAISTLLFANWARKLQLLFSLSWRSHLTCS